MATLQEYMAQSTIPDMFKSEVYNEVWGNDFGVDNSVGKIKKILVHRPGVEIEQLKDGVFEEEAGARILKGNNGRIRNYFKDTVLPDIGLMQYQHDAMTQILKDNGIKIVQLEDPTYYWTNLLFARDVALMVPKGAILTRFAMYFHAGDTYVTQKMLANENIPIIGAIQGAGSIEGGSFSMLDSKTAIIGRSVRINDAGIEQLRALLSYQGIELIVVDLPAYYIHLDEAFLPVDKDKILVSTFILPHWFLKFLRERGYTLIETDMDDPKLTNNCIALEPGKILFSATGEKTRKNLERAGVETVTVDITEINKMGGGIHCSTLPLKRESI